MNPKKYSDLGEILSDMQNDYSKRQERNRKSRANYAHNKRKLAKLNRLWPVKGMQIETMHGAVSYVEDIYEGRMYGSGKTVKIIRYTTAYDNKPSRQCETYLVNFLRNRKIKYID